MVSHSCAWCLKYRTSRLQCVPHDTSNIQRKQHIFYVEKNHPLKYHFSTKTRVRRMPTCGHLMTNRHATKKRNRCMVWKQYNFCCVVCVQDCIPCNDVYCLSVQICCVYMTAYTSIRDHAFTHFCMCINFAENIWISSKLAGSTTRV